MKRCATCDREYDDAYDACPHCVREAKAKKDQRPTLIFAGMFAVGLALYFLGLVSLGGLLMGLAPVLWIGFGIVGFFRGIGQGYKQG